ncbi:[LysW]-lysine hydrolase [Halobaculum sp. MBLA0143]|uniref:[LysW]-lysine hydrolase n=1 Tax=Halobaculum sp. MBLA0143 TaxID=3079933 RepID=UPI0035258A60
MTVDGRAAAGTDAVDSPAESAALDTPVRQLLCDLVATPSPSGEEADAGRLLAAFLRGCGREVHTDAVGNVRAPAPGTEEGDDVLLTSHVDTVPGEVPVRVETVSAAEARWGHSPVPDVGGDDEVAELWGRGSVDATGPLATMAVAAVETGASFAAVVGEERGSRGARHLVGDRPAPAAVVNGEPSGWDALTLGYRGFLPVTYTVETAAGHASRPEPNAVQYATAWWRRIADRVVDDGGTLVGDDDTARPPDEPAGDAEGVSTAVTATPTQFDGGSTEDGAVRATVEAQFRIPPDTTAATLRERVVDATPHGTLSWGTAIPPTTASPRTELARAFRAAIRTAGGDTRLLRKTGTADANLYADAWGVPTVTYGPGDSTLDHTSDERVPLPAVDHATAVLVDAVERLR